jgi:Nuclease A inhibitor-like protein
MHGNPVLESLTKASEGLLFPSETEAELEPFLWEAAAAPTRERLCTQAGAAASAAVEKGTLADLLRTVPSADRPKFQALQVTLEAQLSDIQVYKVGDEPEKTVWIVGKTADGRWAGLKTTVVET